MTIFVRRVAPYLLLVLVPLLVFWQGLGGAWLFDDYPNIVNNPLVQPHAATWPELWRAMHGYEPGAIGRPLSTLSFAVDYLIGGSHPWVYKLHNLLLHLLNATLVCVLLRRLLSLTGAKTSMSATAALTVALLWAIHPLQVSTVLYVVQRMEMLALTFVLLALIAYLRGRSAQAQGRLGWPWMTGSAALVLLGLMAKETAALVPLYALVLEWTVLRFDAKETRTRRFLMFAYTAGTIVCLAVFLCFVLPRYAAPGAFAGRPFDLMERLLTQLRVLPMYLGQMLLPLPESLRFYYDAYPKSIGWLHPLSTLAGALLLAALLAFAWLVRRRFPLLALGILWFFASHVLTSNIFNLELAFEHRNYFALLGILLALGELIARIPMRNGPALKRFAVVVLVATTGFLGYMRAATWGNEMQLAMSLVAYSPESPRASSDLATLYGGMSGLDADSPFYSLAVQEFERGAALPTASPLPEQGLILLAAESGQRPRPEWWGSMVHKLQTRPIGVQETIAVRGLLQQRYKGLELDDQRLSQVMSAFLARGMAPAQMYAEYGDYCLKFLHDASQADRMFVAAIEHNPKDVAYAAQILAALISDGRLRQAEAVFARGLQLGLYSGAANPARSATLQGTTQAMP